MRRIGLTVLALFLAGAFGLWWTCFHNKRVETAVWMEAHHRDLAQIRGELDAHPALCKVWIGEAPNVLCDKHLTASDKDAFRRVSALLVDVDGIDVARENDYRGKLGRVSVRIFAQAFASPPEYAEWASAEDTLMPYRPCTAVGLSQWYACDGNLSFI